MLDLLVPAFVTLFVIIDPIGLSPLFIALTQGMTAAERERVGRRALLLSFVLLAAFGLFGERLLTGIGISLAAFRISGGLLLFLTALDMLFERRTDRRERRAGEAPADPSVFPLAMPLIAGPGALTTMILLTSQNGDAASVVGINVVMLAVLGLTYLSFRVSHILARALGPTGIVVLTRLFGILLAALSVQFVLDGLRDYGFVAAS
jgi:multiple antibiotic resistance protein